MDTQVTCLTREGSAREDLDTNPSRRVAEECLCEQPARGERVVTKTLERLSRSSTVGLVLVATVVVGVWLVNPLLSQSPPPRNDMLRGGVASVSSSADLQVVSTILPTGVQQIVVTDPKVRVMAVYHVDAAHGKLQLKSVRSLRWDLGMEEFNSESPLPSELRVLQQ